MIKTLWGNFNISGMYLQEVFLYIAVLLLPFIFWPWAAVPYEIPKVWFFLCWLELWSFVSVISSPSSLTKIGKTNKLTILVFFFLFIIIISSVFGVNLKKSLWGNYYRLDGLMTYCHLIILYLIVSLFWKNTWRNGLIKSIVIGSVGVSMWACVNGFILYVLKDSSVQNWQGAIGVSFGQPNFLTGYLLVTLPFIIYMIRKNKGRIKGVCITFLLLIIIAIGLTLSWAGLFCLLLLVFYFILKLRLNKIGKIIFVITLLFSFIACICVYSFFRNKDFIAESRTRIYMRSMIGVVRRPFLGWGWANADSAINSSVWPLPITFDVYVDKAHSHVLEVLVTSGIFGLLIYILIIVRVYWILIRLFQRSSHANERLWYETWILVFSLFIIHSQTNVISINQEIFFWLTAGIAGYEENKSKL